MFQVVENKNLPHKICERCLGNVFISFELVQLCIASETKLSKPNSLNCELKENETDQDIEESIGNDSLMEYIYEKDCSITVEAISHNSDGSNDVKQATTKYQKYSSADKYFCGECTLSFRNKKIYHSHLKSHDASRKFKCDHCHQNFSKQIHLNVHLRKHIKKEEKQFICSECGEQFIYKYLLKQHIYKHLDTKPFSCDECQKGNNLYTQSAISKMK